jgi:hypothetical protein
MMQTWAAVSIICGQVVIAGVLWRIDRSFGAYTDVLLETHRQNLKIRENMAIQENDLAVAHIHRRSTDPLPEELENAG